MNIPPVYIALGTAISILIIVLFLLFKSRQRDDEFIEIEEDDSLESLETVETLPQIITMYLVPNEPINGAKLLEFFMDHKLQFSEKQKIFHSVSDNRTQFYIATLSSPGTFDVETMATSEFPGLSFFTKPSKSSETLEDFDALCLVLFDAKEAFDASLQSEDKTDITLDQLREIREQISQHA